MKNRFRRHAVILAVAASWQLASCESSDSFDPCDPNPCTEENKGQCTGRGKEAVCSCDSGFKSNPSGLCFPTVRFTELTAGEDHTCGLAADGRAFCWGDDYAGQLGNGKGAPSTCEGFVCAQAPVLVAGGIRFTSLAAGESHT